MVSCGVDRRDLVNTSWETVRDISSENTTLSGSVKTLEEGEHLGVGWGGLVEGLELLNDDVRVALDLSLAVELLGRGEVVAVCVDEEAGLHSTDGHGDGELLVGLDGITVLGVGELRRGHVVSRGEDTHGCGVARTTLDLFTVGDGEVRDGETEVNEVVRGGQRSNLT